MSENTNFDVAIIGAGIAGLSVADALLRRGYNCAIFDRNGPGTGASGAPRVLINPATGRRAKMSWRAPEALSIANDLINRVASYTDTPFFEAGGVIRPAVTEKLAKDFNRSPEKYDWPGGWIEWLDEETFADRFPEFDVHNGGLYIRKGYTLKGDLYLNALSDYLISEDLEIFYNNRVSYYQANNRWKVKLSDSKNISADRIICCGGHLMKSDPVWAGLKLHNIKGQTATFHFPKPLPLKASVSSLGYMAFMKCEPDKLVVGSTYEHHPEYDEPDEYGLEYLTKKLETTFPGRAEMALEVAQWAGYRTTVPDKNPVIGPHPDEQGLYIVGALGSKGMSLGPYLGDLLAEFIASGAEIPSEVSIGRFF